MIKRIIAAAWVRFAWVLCLAAFLAAGCSPAPPAARSHANDGQTSAAADFPPQAASAPDALLATSTAAPADPRDFWEADFIQGKKIGSAHTTFTDLPAQGADPAGVRIGSSQSMVLLRDGEKSTTAFRLTCLETAGGDLRQFTAQTESGSTAVSTEGQVEGDWLKLTVRSPGKTTEGKIPWPKGTGGFFAVDESLARQPMRPGETRKLTALQPVVDQIAAVELTAGKYEQVVLLDRTEELLRIDAVQIFPGNVKMPAVIWTDTQGTTLKSLYGGIEGYRSTQRQALEKSDAAFDLVRSNFIHLDGGPPAENLHRAQQFRYRVSLETGDPSKFFVNGLSQQVHALDAHTAEITVRAVRPDWPKLPAAASSETGKGEAFASPSPSGRGQGEGPTDEDRQPNNLIQSDDPAVRQLARDAAGGETDPWKLACKLENYVNKKIVNKNYGQGFATAAEVAKNPQGDCKEHSVLLAALARTNHIPARVAIGLVYAPQHAGFAFHMWNELWINDRWIPMDAIFGHDGIGAGHLKVAVTSLPGAAGGSALLPVAQLMGQLKIAVAK